MTETENFNLTLRMDATVTMHDALGQPINWLKPGSEVSHTWKGMPTPEEVILKYNDMKEVCAATLEEVLATTQARVIQERRGG